MKKQYSNSRRTFIKTSLKGSVMMAVGIAGIQDLMASPEHARLRADQVEVDFEQAPLPYAYDALEDILDAKTMEIHYSKHAAAYCKNLKEAAVAENIKTDESIESLLVKISKYSMKVRNNAGGHYNHEIFWKMMKAPVSENMPSGKLMEAIQLKFGSFEKMKQQFTDAAKSRFGSGWAWLYADKEGQLQVGSTPNQDNPLMDISEIKGFPILGLDVWEHAYYLKYQNKRADYIENWWKLVNWDYVSSRWQTATHWNG